MKLKKIISTIALGVTMLGFGSSAQAVISTDIVIIVDESGSMGGVQRNLRDNIGTFASILSAGGVDARYALVGYGNSSVKPRMITNFTSAANFAIEAKKLVARGGTEPAYTASAYALNALDNQADIFSFRSNAVKNLIIFTDEPSNGDRTRYGSIGGVTVTKATVDGLLTTNNALYNAVLKGSRTIASLSDLATNHSGSVFDLNKMGSSDQTLVNEFVTQFAKAKLKETIDFCVTNPNDPACINAGGDTVPEPASLALIGLGVIGMGAIRRRKLAG